MLEKNLSSQNMTKVWKRDAKEAGLAVAERTTSAESLTVHPHFHSSEPGCELAVA
jgi:hypothetical protein